MYKKNLLKVVFASLIFSVLFIFFSQSVFAESSQRGLVLSPLRNELEIAPGTSANGVLTITNSTDKSMNVSLNAEIFNVINQQYDYAFTEDSNVTKWISFDKSSFEMAPEESVKVTFMINVPLQSEPGGRYLSLFVSNDTATSGGLNYRQRIASLLYITVTGNVSREGHLLSLTSPWLITGNNVWSVNLQNTGTTHYKSRYSTQIVSLFGDKTILSGEVGESLILPGSIRSVSADLPLPSVPGIYKVIYTVGLGDNPAQVETRYILYMPVPYIVLITTFIIILVSWLRGRKSKKD